MSTYHTAVMLRETVDGLDMRPDGVYVDVTFGGGGHSREILRRLGPEGRLIAFDQDEDARRNLPEDDRLIFIAANFRHLKARLRVEGYRQVDGILADLGVSSHQLDEGERGFSYRYDAPLDMRMNRLGGDTAADLLNGASAEQLHDWFGRYGEVRNARTLGQHIAAERAHRPIRTTGDLLGLLEGMVIGKRPRYLSQVFQALRIAVNDEMGALEQFLTEAEQVLAPGGRLSVLSYHSLEDRMVKNMLKSGTLDGKHLRDFYGNIYRPYKLITKKAVEATADENALNSRARSARLRIGARTTQTRPTEADMQQPDL